MKRTFTLLSLALGLLLASCSDSNSNTPELIIDPPTGNIEVPDITVPAKMEDIVGEWKLEKWLVDKDFDIELYLELKADGTLHLYQNLSSHGFERLNGTFTFDAEHQLIKGRYASGEEFCYSYFIRDVDKEHMSWYATNLEDASRYVRTTIPEDIKAGTRSGDAVRGIL